jgi:hypothetical protein
MDRTLRRIDLRTGLPPRGPLAPCSVRTMIFCDESADQGFQSPLGPPAVGPSDVFQGTATHTAWTTAALRTLWRSGYT